MNSETQLKDIFLKILNLPEDTETSVLQYGKTAPWTSVAHMKLIAEIEKVFNIMLDVDDIIAMSSFSEAINILSRHDIKFENT